MGGQKYIYNNILFKFANIASEQTKTMFSNDESLAQKAAANEIRAMNAVIDADIPHLHITLTTLIYVQGRCLIATAIAPLDGQNTLAYGSCDAAKTIKKQGKLVDMVNQLAEIVRLKEHKVMQRSDKTELTLCGPVDMEGHVGKDGLCYVLDLARLFPPRFCLFVLHIFMFSYSIIFTYISFPIIIIIKMASIKRRQ